MRIFVLWFIMLYLFGCGGCGDEKWGFIDKNGRLVVDPKYDEVRSFSSKKAIVYRNRNIGFIDYSGKEILNPDKSNFFTISDFIGEYAFFLVGESDSNVGFIRDDGSVNIGPVYSQLSFFNGTVAGVKKADSDYFLINMSNRVLTDRGFDYLDCFKNMLTQNCIDDNVGKYKLNDKWGLINIRDGRIITNNEFDDIIYGDRSRFIVKKDGRFGAVDEKGKEIIPVQYESLVFSEGYFTFSLNGKYGLMDYNGNKVIEPRYDRLSKIGNSYAVYCNGMCYRCSDFRCEREDLPLKINSCIRYSLREIYIREDGSEVGIVNLKGEEFRFDSYNVISVYSNGRGIVCDMNIKENNIRCRLIDTNRNIFSQEEWCMIREFFDERAIVSRGDFYGLESGEFYFVDINGKRINETPYYGVMDFSEGFAGVIRNKEGFIKWVFIDKEGNVVTEEYDRVMPFVEGRAAVCRSVFCNKLGGGH